MGLYAKLKLIVETKNGKRTVKLPDNKTYDLDEEPKDVDVEGWVIDAFNEESRMKIGNLSKGRQPNRNLPWQLRFMTQTSSWRPS